jgi:putative phosphoesterase
MKHSDLVRVALISDVHANLPALKAVTQDPEFLECVQVLFAGDLVGYYYWPAECFQVLKEFNTHSILGNHEEMLFSALDTGNIAEITARYGSGIQIAMDQLSSESIAEMRTWQHPDTANVDGHKLLLCHGSPSDISTYLYPSADLPHVEQPDQDTYEIVVHGHTHYPSVRSSEGVLWINPGSLGQPRNKQPGAHWAILDTESMETFPKITPYDYSSVVDMAQKTDPSLPYLWEVLGRA